MTLLRTFVFRLWAPLRSRQMAREIDDGLPVILPKRRRNVFGKAFPPKRRAAPLNAVSVA